MRFWYIGLGMLCLTAETAQGHHIWILPADKGDSVRVVWSDDLQPDNKDELLTTIDKAEVLLRHAEGRVETLKWTQDKDVYRVACPGVGPRTLAVIWNNDFLVKKGGTTLVTYLCKTYLADPTGKVPVPEKASSWEQLGFEIVPRPDRGAEIYQLLYKGQPVANTKAIPEIPDETWKQLSETEQKQLSERQSDKDGLFSFKPPKKPGIYGFRARHVAAEKGEYQGKPFNQRRYFSCLVIQVPAAPVKKSP